MADIIVDVSLPSPITTNVTSPTQALATNISVPGPQGPAGPRGFSPLINGITGQSILFSGKDGIIISADQSINTIYISGNSGYFEGKINSLTTNLESTGNNLYNLLINFSGNLDANYATDLQLYNTGSTLDNKINSLSGWSASAINLQQTGENLYSLLINFSGNLDTNYASDAQLFTTGSTLDTKINSLSGYSASEINLASTGSNLYTLITNFSGNLDTDFASQAELNSLSGYINSSSSNIIFTTGNQIKSGRLIIGDTIVDASYPYTLSLQSNTPETWLEILNHSGANQGVFFGIDDNNFEQWNSQAGDILFVTSENPMDGTERLRIKNDGKVGIGTSAPSEKLQVIGNIIANNLIYNTGNQTISGIKTFNLAPIISGNPFITGNLSLYATAVNLALTGSNLYLMLTGFSGNLDATYATDSQLVITGSTLDNKINSLSGSSASSTNLATTGSILDNKINNLSGYVTSADATFATITNLVSTGSTLDTKINSLSGWSASAVNLTSTGATLITNLFNTGSTLNTKIDNLSGYVNTQDVNISTNLYNTGNTLNTKINTLSGYTDSQDTTIANNLRTTGSTLDTKINNLSGYVNTQDNSISNNLTSTGITLNNKINSLSGVSVLTYGDQIVVGTKYFNEDVYIHNLYVTGDEFIANVTNNFVESPYLLLNITGGAIDGGIFFVTGSGFTGINDYGPIIGFDHSNKFKIGVARRSDDLSFLPDIASVQQIEAYSGVANNTFSTITNLALTGSTLNNKINSLSGWSASAANLYTTGSTLDIKINSLSGWSASAVNLASTGSTLSTNLANTGSTLDTKINSLSGNLTSTYATITNLASTGSTLNTRINNLSGYINSTSSNIVFTTGNQTISGVKSFAQDTTFGDSAQGDFLVISGNQFTVYGSGNFTSGLFVNSSPVLTGSSTLYATTVNLASTGSTLDNKINNLSGVSVLRFGDQTISGNKTFINRLSASTGFFGDNIFAFGNWIGISAGSGNYASGDYAFIGGGQCNRATATYATVGGGASNFASGISSTIGGGQRNGATAANSNVGGGCGNCAVGNYSNVGGGCLNCALGNSSTIGGGFRNCAIGNSSNIGGGYRNCATAAHSTVGGGNRNCAIGNCSTIGGGCYNTASGAFSNIGGGYRNITFGDCATVGGGARNRACCGSATIGGGCCNTASGACSFLGGGFCNSIVGIAAIIVGGCCNSAIGDCATVGGGACNRACCGSATIGGGSSNTACSIHTTVGGGCYNRACANFATVGGGCSNTASVNNATVGGGGCNAACNSFATIGGGCYNRANGTAATVGGGCGNCAVCASATVGGGCGNRACCDFATVGGGCCNFICSTFTTIGGGVANCACGSAATVGGGATNRACLNFATVAGGCYNRANGTAATVGGGYRNAACNSFATVGGGSCNSVLAEYSYILGGRCSTIISAHSGAAVLGDGQLRPHNSFSAHSLTLDFKSGVYFAQPYIYGSGSGSLEFLSPLLAPNLVYNTGNQTISGVKTFIGNHNISGNLNAFGNYYVKLARLSDQTISQGSDAVIQFSGIADPNNWYNSGTYRTTPTIAGNYCINVMASWKKGSVARNNQTNIQIRKGTTTIALTQAPVESGLNFSVYATAIATLNGTTGDYINVTAYTDNTTNQDLVGEVGGSWTKMEMFKLN